MTSGLRSVRDKSLTYFEEAMERERGKHDRLFKVVNCFARQVRQVAKEDSEALEESGLPFNIHALIGGQMPGDKEHHLYLLYPQANWVEIGEGTPYQIIGSAHYGKPVMDRTLKHSDSIPFALKVGSLAFDSTRISAADVDFPVDVVMYRKGSFKMVEKRFTKAEMQENADWWQTRLRDSVNQLSSAWYEKLFEAEQSGDGSPIPQRTATSTTTRRRTAKEPSVGPKKVNKKEDNG